MATTFNQSSISGESLAPADDIAAGRVPGADQTLTPVRDIKLH